jgi:hypothetical protein
MSQRSGFRFRRISASLAVLASFLDGVLLAGPCQYLCGCLGFIVCAESFPIQNQYLRPTDVIVAHGYPPTFLQDVIESPRLMRFTEANDILDIGKRLSSLEEVLALVEDWNSAEAKALETKARS